MNNVICKQNVMFFEESFRNNDTLYVHFTYKYFDRFSNWSVHELYKKRLASFSRHNKSTMYKIKRSEPNTSNNMKLDKEDTKRRNLVNI